MVIRNCQSKKARQYNDKGNQKLSIVNQRNPDNTMVIRNCQSKKARQYNDKGNQKLSIKERQTLQ